MFYFKTAIFLSPPRKEPDTRRKEPINIPQLDRGSPDLDPQGPAHQEDPRYKSCLDSQDIRRRLEASSLSYLNSYL